MVENAMRSISESQWLENDVFNYVCNDELVLFGTSENTCLLMETGILTWSLSRRQNNLPTCSKPMPFKGLCQPSRTKFTALYGNQVS